MPRLARTVAVGSAHHITQRGNNRQDVFFVDDDRRVYLELLAEQARKYGLEVQGYCLMTNHVHLVAVPRTPEALAKAVGRTHFRYTQYINRFHKRSGHLWQGRFYSCALDARHFWLAMKYVELNPVRAKLCRKPWRYAWSSAAAHVGEEEWERMRLDSGGNGRRMQFDEGNRGQVQPAARNVPGAGFPSSLLRTGQDSRRAGNGGQVQPAAQNVPVPHFRPVPDLLNLDKWFERVSGQEWRAKLGEGLAAAEVERLRLRTHTGRPLGSDGFLSKLETKLGRRVRPLPKGRPRKQDC